MRKQLYDNHAGRVFPAPVGTKNTNTGKSNMREVTMKKRKLKNVRPEDAIRDENGKVVGKWNGRCIESLVMEMNRVFRRHDCVLTDREMPHRGQIPADVL